MEGQGGGGRAGREWVWRVFDGAGEGGCWREGEGGEGGGVDGVSGGGVLRRKGGELWGWGERKRGSKAGMVLVLDTDAGTIEDRNDL